MSNAIELWDRDRTHPQLEQIPMLDEVCHRIPYRGTEGAAFLHGVAIVDHAGKLFCSWASSPVDENSTSETVLCVTSEDDGRTWSSPQTICPGYPDDRNHSHGAFLSVDGTLWLFVASFLRLRTQDKVFPGLRTEAFVFNEGTQEWRNVGVVAENFWPYEQPRQMSNGHWIMGGQDESANCIVAVSDGDLREWKSIAIPTPEGVTLRFGETATVVNKDEVTAIIRYRAGTSPSIPDQVAIVSTSSDYGQTWSVAAASNLPAGNSKLYVGTLTDGRRYAVYNADTPQQRSALLIATSRPGESLLRHVWRVQSGYPPNPRFPGFGKRCEWSYPYAYEYKGNLMVGYSINKEDFGLSVIPIDRLVAGEDRDLG